MIEMGKVSKILLRKALTAPCNFRPNCPNELDDTFGFFSLGKRNFICLVTSVNLFFFLNLEKKKEKGSFDWNKSIKRKSFFFVKYLFLNCKFLSTIFQQSEYKTARYHFKGVRELLCAFQTKD